MQKGILLLAFMGLTAACEGDSPGPSSSIMDNDMGMVDSGNSEETGNPTGECDVEGDGAATTIISDENGTATVSVVERDACLRTYRLTTTASLRDGVPQNPRVITEVRGPTTRTGNDMFDALYALALEEAREATVSQIQDGGFNDGNPVPCGGCFETGRLWKYVWTRDTSYAVDLGLAVTAPEIAKNSLLFKLSERRGGGDLQIVQDTGTGGSYPVSSDRVVWALGARALVETLPRSERADFEAQALEALKNTIAMDRRIVFDAADGLYAGEQSFLDWREQTYPKWSAQFPAAIAQSKTLSTNVLHYIALDFASSIAERAGETGLATRYGQWASQLKERINERFWLPERGLYATMSMSPFANVPVERFDLLGSALAVLSGVASTEQSKAVLRNYPHLGAAASVVWPQEQLTPIYHNRAQWPFVTAYWLRAAVAVDNSAVAERMVAALMRGAALNLSNMENFEAVSGSAYVEDGEFSGPVVNSQRQIWSVAGYIGMVQNIIFGVTLQDGQLLIRPYITAPQRNELFKGQTEISLRDLQIGASKLNVTIELPKVTSGGPLSILSTTVDGEAASGSIALDALGDTAAIRVTLGAPRAASTLTEVDGADWRDVYSPRVPIINSVLAPSGNLEVTWGRNGEVADVTWRIYRNGERVATGLGNATQSWTDHDVDAATDRPCYTVEACFEGRSNCSHQAQAACWWGDGFSAIRTLPIHSFANTGGSASDNHGRYHFENWGDTGHTLTMSGLQVSDSGRYLVQAVYGNGAGGVTTGITCAVKKLIFEDETGATQVGALVMPHLENWDIWSESTPVGVNLDASHTYKVTIAADVDYINMSAFAHFADYTAGEGGRSGEFNRVNIAELKLLYRPP